MSTLGKQVAGYAKRAAVVENFGRTTPVVHSVVDKLVHDKSEMRPPEDADLQNFQGIADYMHAVHPHQLSDARVFVGEVPAGKMIQQLQSNSHRDNPVSALLGTRDMAAQELALIPGTAWGQHPSAYMPITNSVLINDASPGVAIHELGHAIDMQRKGLFGNTGRDIRNVLKPALVHEFNAWRKGRKAYQQGFAASGDAEDPEKLRQYLSNMQSYNGRKYPAYGTYLGGALGGATGLAAGIAGVIAANSNGYDVPRRLALLPALIGGAAGVPLGALLGRYWASSREGANAAKALRQLQALRNDPQAAEIRNRLIAIRNARASQSE